MLSRFDDHCWLTADGKAWAIKRMKGSLIFLWRGYYPHLEYSVLDVSRVNWDSYCEAAAKLLEKGEYRMFGKLFGAKAKEAINQFSGNKDFLEGLCAGCALVAAADGTIDDAEFEMTLKVIQANSAISTGFTASQIETTFSRLSQKTGTRSGKAELKQEIREVIEKDKSSQLGTAIVLACLDVADQGGISDKEETILREISSLCNVSYDKLAAG